MVRFWPDPADFGDAAGRRLSGVKLSRCHCSRKGSPCPPGIRTTCVNRKLKVCSAERSPTVFGSTLWMMPMEADDRIAVVIAALNSFEPSRDDTDNLYRLNQLFEGFRSLPDRDRVAPAMF